MSPPLLLDEHNTNVQGVAGDGSARDGTDSTIITSQPATPYNVSCHRSSASENGIGIRISLASLTHRVTIPRTHEGAPDVELMLRWVREGWVGQGTTPWALPSTGRPGPRCGIHLGTSLECLGCENRWPVMTSCRGWVCPQCSPSRVRQQAMAVAIRVASITDSLALAGGDGITTRRAILSPSPERAVHLADGPHGHQRMASLRRQAWDLARTKGFLGGALVHHPWRDRQTWRFEHWGPHFHVIGPARWLDEGDGEGGWLFKASPARLRVGGVYDRMAYDLTHVGVVPSKPVVTYHGMVHPRYRKGALLDDRIKTRIAALEGGRTHVCPECSSTNTRSTIPTLEDLERWGIMRPLERHRREILQHRFQCDDCGHVDGLEPVPEAPGPEASPVNPWHYTDPDRAPGPRGDHWTDGDEGPED